VGSQSLQRDSWEKVAKVLGVDNIFDPTFSKGKKDFEPKEEKARQRGRSDGMKGRRGSKSKIPQNNEIEEKRFVEVSQKLQTEGSMHEGKEENRRCSKSENSKENNKMKEEQDIILKGQRWM